MNLTSSARRATALAAAALFAASVSAVLAEGRAAATRPAAAGTAPSLGALRRPYVVNIAGYQGEPFYVGRVLGTNAYIGIDVVSGNSRNGILAVYACNGDLGRSRST